MGQQGIQPEYTHIGGVKVGAYGMSISRNANYAYFIV